MKEYAGKEGQIALVSGGAGFVGSRLCALLLQKGYKVLCFDNFSTSSRDNLAYLSAHPDFTLLEHDISKAFTQKLPPLTHIFHLASPASPVDYQRLPIETLLANSLGTYNMLDLAREHGAKFLFASSSEVYGDPRQHPQREDYWGNINPIGVRSCYDESKRFSEALAMAFHRKYHLDVKIARIFNTYGPGMREHDGRVIPNFITEALQGKPLTIYGDGKQTRSFCFISDLIEGIFLMMESNYKGPVNLGSPDEYTILELAQIIKGIVGSASELLFVPLRQDDPQMRKPDISKARQILGWEPRVKIEEGLKETVKYFRLRI